MAEIVVAFSKDEVGKQLAAYLRKNGYSIFAICHSANSCLSKVDNLNEAIIVCQDRLSDMYYNEFIELLPERFQVIVLRKTSEFEDEFPRERVRCISSPIRLDQIVITIEELSRAKNEKHQKRKPKVRTIEDERIIEGAKLLLMVKKGITEDEAHKLLIRLSMNNRISLRETAERVRELCDLQ